MRPFSLAEIAGGRETTTRSTRSRLGREDDARATPAAVPRLQPGLEKGNSAIFLTLTSLSLITSLRCRMSFRYQRPP